MKSTIANRKLILKLSACAAMFALGLSACGGGGGDSGGGGSSGPSAPSTPVAITETNAQGVSNEAVSALMETGATEGVTGAAVTESPATPQKMIKINSALAKRLGLYLDAPQVVTGVTETYNCSVSGTVTYNDHNSSDQLTITFNNCSDNPGETLNGSIAIANASGTETNFTADVSIDLTFTVTGEPTFSVVGGYNINYSSSPGTYESNLLSGSRLAFVYGAEVDVLTNFNISEGVDFTFTPDRFDASSNFSLASTRLNGGITVTTTSRFYRWATALYPHQGSLEVVGANNSRLRLTVLGNESAPGNQVRIEVDANGDGTYELTIETTWAALAAS